MTEATTTDSSATEVAPIDPIAARLAPIRAALATDASADLRRAALDPLRAIYAEIMASLGAIAAPSIPAPSFVVASAQPLRGMTIDQVLDLVIVQLRAVAGDGAGAAGAGPLGQLLGGVR